jgi:nitrile hydratase
MASLPVGATAFAPGDAIRVTAAPTAGHCRIPGYLRGREGRIVEVLGRYRDPGRLAYHKPGWPAQVLYKVRFRQAHLWRGYAGPPTDELEADLYEAALVRG